MQLKYQIDRNYFQRPKTHHWHKCGEDGPFGEAFLVGSVTIYINV